MTLDETNPARKDMATRDTMRLLLSFAENLREIDSDMPIIQVSILMHIAMNDGVTQREITNKLGIATSTASRSIASLSEIHRLRKPGMGLITWYDDPMDRRVKHLTLTHKGRSFFKKLTT